MKVIILGTGSMAYGVASILINDRNFEVIGFTDNKSKSKGKKILGFEVIGTHDILEDLFKQDIKGAVVAIGYDNNVREKYFHQVKAMGFEMINVIHPSALIDVNVHLDEGIIIGPGCIISPQVVIERNTILDAGIIIGSNTEIADDVCIGVGSCIGGGGTIKRNAYLSTGCSVAPHVTIGKNAKIGPGTSITEDIPDEARSEA